ncbi:MAG TPA: hypothetical protein VNA44_02605 [Burkholderiaceae bacterium]|nr:hypothetical protein [Burkholderiaceae bacterium]
MPDGRVEAPFASWQELLWAMARARRARLETPAEPEIARPGRGFSGCLVRLVFIVVLLFLAFVLAPILFGGLLFGIY